MSMAGLGTGLSHGMGLYVGESGDGGNFAGTRGINWDSVGKLGQMVTLAMVNSY